jgi:predicted phosphodiesterase
MTRIWAMGDPHGVWSPLEKAFTTISPERRPAALVLLGDCELDLPLKTKLGFIVGAGVELYYIIGNHDADHERQYDFLVNDHPDGNLHAKAVSVGTGTIAGLGGVFRGRVWFPRDRADSEAKFMTRSAHLATLPRNHRYKGGLPMSARASIYPEDIETLSGLRGDILFCHEAPKSHQKGFMAIDTVAKDRYRMVVHGHHHEPYFGETVDEVPVLGLGISEIVEIELETLQTRTVSPSRPSRTGQGD